MSDSIDDIFDEIKKFIRNDLDIVDLDFFILPESARNPLPIFNNKNTEGFKISYHFETGMDKPEIKIEGDYDEKKLNNYMKQFNSGGIPMINKQLPNPILDANDLSLDLFEPDDESSVLEPYTEINDFDDFSEILIEVPGLQEDEITISFNNEGDKMTFIGQKASQMYKKSIKLPFKSSINDYSLELNNGIALIKVLRGKS